MIFATFELQFKPFLNTKFTCEETYNNDHHTTDGNHKDTQRLVDFHHRRIHNGPIPVCTEGERFDEG